MNLARYMSPDIMELYLPAPEEPPDNPDLNLQKFNQRQKEKYIGYFVEMLMKSGNVLHQRKLTNDFINRERQASTALADGIAMPHVRSRYVREVMVGFARSEEGIEFNALDGGLSHLFFIIVSPSAMGDIHLKIYRQLAMLFEFTNAREELMTVTEPGEVIRITRAID